MKLNTANESASPAGAATAFKNACLGSCQKILHQIARAKEALFAESRHALRKQEHLIRLALNEAEGLAWQTTYPHLVFPALAAEKIQKVADWNTRQQSVLRHRPISKLAA